MSWPLWRRCCDEIADFLVGRVGGERDRRLLAGLARRVFGVSRPEPLPLGDEAGERARQLRQQRLPHGHRQIVARQQVLADRRQMAEPPDDALDRGERDVGVAVLEQGEAGLRRRHLGDGGGDRGGQQHATGDGELGRRPAGGDEIDEVVVADQRRALEQRLRHLELVGGERPHHHRRRLLRRGEDLGHGLPHQRRRVVEQHDHRAFGGGEIVGGEIGMEIGARQRGGGLGALAGTGGANPLQELTDNHGYRRDKPTAHTGGQ